MALLRILLADDIKSWREFASSVLRKDPSLEVIGEVSDGLKAVQMAEKLQPAVVLLNLNLPNLSGIQAGGWIRKLAPNTKIVFLSEQLEADIVEVAMKLGAGAYILKSEAARDLVAAIHAVARGETFLTCRLAARLHGWVLAPDCAQRSNGLYPQGQLRTGPAVPFPPPTAVPSPKGR